MIIAQFPASEQYAVRVESCGESFSAIIVNRQGDSLGGVVRSTEERARAAANVAYTNLRLGLSPADHNMFHQVCVWCHKPGRPGNPLLFGLKNTLTHEGCES